MQQCEKRRRMPKAHLAHALEISLISISATMAWGAIKKIAIF
jgi:hypothetical protein